MVLPTRLSEDALAILRSFVAAGSRHAGSPLPLPALRETWKRAANGIGLGLSELQAAGLVEAAAEESAAAVLTEEGEAFFRRYLWSCHGAG